MADWDTSLVTDMSSLFERKSSFNQDISGWNVGAVTDMSSMFNNAGSFNRDLNTWDVSNVLDMSGMFGGNGGMNFNGDITGWNVGKVQDMSGMFVFQTKFDKNLGSWNVGSVSNMRGMFQYATAFNGDISSWDVSSVTDMSNMFHGGHSSSAFDVDITGWNVRSDANVQNMFLEAPAWVAAYTNCGHNSAQDSAVCTGSFAVSVSAYDGPPGAWVLATCDASTPPGNGTFGDCTDSLAVGHSCQPTCDVGFSPSGPTSCSTGVLSAAICLDKSGGPCDASAPPSNGSVGTCTSSLASGTTCQPSCEMGYTVSSFSFCSGGRFTSATCNPNPCDASMFPTNGGVGTCTSSLASGSSCTPTCNSGYSLSGSRSCSSGILADTVGCKADSPPPSSASPPTLDPKKAAAEKTRDAMLGGITDARMKKKAKLLADAAIAGKKVKKMSAKLSAADEDTACSDYYTKAGISSSLGACTATAASRRRSLAATTYDVSVFFSEAEVDDATITDAENSLKAEGVTGVETSDPIDPIAELGTIHGVDSSTLETFKAEVSAVAALMPPSPSPPPPSLILDDDDHAANPGGLVLLLAISMITILLL